MQATEIAPEQWDRFFRQFSREHAGWQSAIELHRPDAIPERMADGLPLKFIGLANGTSDGWSSPSIAIHAGDGEPMTHTIGRVCHVFVAESPDTPDALVHIEPTSGPTTVLRIWSMERRTE
jgi:hypothetical protein